MTTMHNIYAIGVYMSMAYTDSGNTKFICKGVKNRTINYSLQVVRRILYLAAYDWRHQTGLTWLETAPKIRFLPEADRRKPYPMCWEEQGRLLRELPPHLQRMALFKVNTGCREVEVCACAGNGKSRYRNYIRVYF